MERMKDIQTCGPSSVMVNPFKGQGLSPQAERRVRLLSHVHTASDQRGKGHATKLMKQIGLMADLNGLALVLKPEPYDESPMNQEQLIAWYAKHGFMTLQAEPELLLYRPPKAARQKPQ